MKKNLLVMLMFTEITIQDGNMRFRNGQITDGAGWERRYNIADAYSVLLENVYEVSSDSARKISAWYNSSTPFSTNQSNYNNLPVGSKIIDVQAGVVWLHQTATTWIYTILASEVSYKKYVALLSQSDTGAPVATVLENTLGGTVVWTRSNVGDYRGTLSGAFTTNKTVIFISPPTSGASTHISTWSNTNQVGVETYFDDALVSADNQLVAIGIEIRVYL